MGGKRGIFTISVAKPPADDLIFLHPSQPSRMSSYDDAAMDFGDDDDAVS